MKILETPRFRRSFGKLSRPVRNKVKKQLQLFLKNIFHPSLHTEKLEPRYENIWSFRVDRNYRAIFTWGPDTLVLLDIGPHDIYRKH